MNVNGKIFWGNLIIKLMEHQRESISISDCEKILHEVQERLKVSEILLTDVTLQQFIQENDIVEISYCDGKLLSPYSDLGDKKVDLAHHIICEKRELLKRQYTEEQLNEFTLMLSDISKDIRKKEIETKILPRCKRHYQVGAPIVLISTINDIFNGYVSNKSNVQYKKDRKNKNNNF